MAKSYEQEMTEKGEASMVSSQVRASEGLESMCRTLGLLGFKPEDFKSGKINLKSRGYNDYRKTFTLPGLGTHGVTRLDGSVGGHEIKTIVALGDEAGPRISVDGKTATPEDSMKFFRKYVEAVNEWQTFLANDIIANKEVMSELDEHDDTEEDPLKKEQDEAHELLMDIL